MWNSFWQDSGPSAWLPRGDQGTLCLCDAPGSRTGSVRLSRPQRENWPGPDLPVQRGKRSPLFAFVWKHFQTLWSPLKHTHTHPFLFTFQVFHLPMNAYCNNHFQRSLEEFCHNCLQKICITLYYLILLILFLFYSAAPYMFAAEARAMAIPRLEMEAKQYFSISELCQHP